MSEDTKEPTGEPENEPAEGAAKEAAPVEKLEPQDNQDILKELAYLGVRLDTGDDGYVWRAFLYENHDDDVLKLVRGLPKVRELWTIGSKVSAAAIESFREDNPEAVIHP